MSNWWVKDSYLDCCWVFFLIVLVDYVKTRWHPLCATSWKRDAKQATNVHDWFLCNYEQLGWNVDRPPLKCTPPPSLEEMNSPQSNPTLSVVEPFHGNSPAPAPPGVRFSNSWVPIPLPFQLLVSNFFVDLFQLSTLLGSLNVGIIWFRMFQSNNISNWNF